MIVLSVIVTGIAVLAIATMGGARDSVTINGEGDLTAANGVTGGSGTEADPYVIEGLDINGTMSYCLYINYTDSHIVITGMNLSLYNRTHTGIYLDHVSNVTIRDMTFFNLSTDVEARYSHDITVENLTSWRGRLSFLLCDRITVDNYHKRPHWASNNFAAIALSDAVHVSVSNCTVVGSYYGVRLAGVDHARVHDNWIKDVQYGISAERRIYRNNTDVLIENNTINNYTSTAVYLRYVYGLGLANTTITGQGYNHDMDIYGKRLWYIRDNTMEAGGIRLGYYFPEEGVWDFQGNILRGVEISYYKNMVGIEIPLDTNQVILWNCSRCNITGPFQAPYGPNITILASSNITVSGLDFAGEWFDLIANLVWNLTVEDCTFRDYRYGLWLTEAKDAIVRGCTFVDCSGGLILNDCQGALVEDCTFTGCGAGIGEAWESIFRPGDLITIRNNTFRDSYSGISVELLNNALISGNRFINLRNHGILIEYSGSRYPNTNVTIAQNLFINCTYGMELQRMKHLSVRENTFEGSGTGIKVFYSESGRISGNDILNSSKFALEITAMSEGFVVVGNVFENSYRYGLMIDSTGCRIYLNDFINNSWGYNQSRQVYDRLGNQWDDQEVGNYWDDYLEWYPDATNDGTVWSDPYDVSWAGQYFDNFPLVHRFDLEPPVADGGGNQTVEEGTHVTFDGTGSRDDRGIVRYEWTFMYDMVLRELGGPTVGFTFDIPGVYRVDLRVFDAMGNEGSAVLWLTVLDVKAPSVSIGSKILAEQFTMLTLDGSGCFDNGGIANYTWTIEWPEGPLVLYGKFPLMYCGHAGEFNVTLRVTDHAGHSAEDTATLTVLDREAPTAHLPSTYVVDQGEELHLDATNCTDNVAITKYTWTLANEDGTETIEGDMVFFSWTLPGNYSCRLTLRDRAGNENSTRFYVTVMDTEPPVIEDPGEQWTNIGVPYRFPPLRVTDNVEVDELRWSFEDDGRTISSGEPRPTYTFHSPGVYPLSLVARDTSGNEAFLTFNLTVVDPDAPIARAGEDQRVSVGATVTLSGAGSVDNDGIVRYSWSFRHGDGTVVLDGMTVSFTFTEVGAHLVTLTVWDSSSNNATDTVTITVLDTIAPVARITAATTVDEDRPVTFRGKNSEDNVGVVNWTWSFHHNGTDVVLYGVNVTFVFEIPGTYTVTLTVRDGQGLEDEAKVDIWVREVIPDGPDDGTNGDAKDWLPLIPVVLLIMLPLVIVSALFVLKKRQAPPGAPDGGDEANASDWVEFQ